MAFVNLYKPPVTTLTLPTEDGPWDMNFCLPIPTELSKAVTDHPELYHYLPYGPFHKDDPESLAKWHEHRIRGDPATLLFAIVDKTSPSPSSHLDQGGALAGVLGYLNTVPTDLWTEIGHVIVFPKWQRTFVATNAVALLLIHALEVPNTCGSASEGWGLRRVQWQANAQNAPSIRAAERLGLKLEGIIRWQRLIHVGPTQYGVIVEGRKGDPIPEVPGRHSAILAMCWDHYSREALETLIARTK